MTGQEAAKLAVYFDSAVGITRESFTILDVDSRGGAADSVLGVSTKSIKFVGTGEMVKDLEPFHPDRMASRILGLGNVVSLVEKPAAEVSDAEASATTKNMSNATFDLDEFFKQSELITKIEAFAGVAKMIPGIACQINANQITQVEKRFKKIMKRLKKNMAMIGSLAKKEIGNLELFVKDRSCQSRLRRITADSRTIYEVGV